MLTGLPLKLIGYGLGALALIGMLLTINSWRVNAAERKAKLEIICKATRDASGQPKLKCSDVPMQIAFMAESIKTLSDSLARQNAAVKTLGDETVKQQAEAAKAVSNAAGRAQKAEDTSRRLEASARAGGPSAGAVGQCKPSKALQEAWR